VFITGKYDVKGEVTRGEGDKAKKSVEPLITEREKALFKEFADASKFNPRASFPTGDGK